ncbi:MAG: UbiA-like polyprenyltransferase [Myxococcota bacterium]
MSRWLSASATYASMIKLSHSVFALPFALAAAVIASRQVSVTAAQIGLILGCMVLARSSAMGFNRLVDRHIDAKNPRTAGREIPAGKISVGAAWAFTIGSALAFVGCAALLGPATLALSPVAIAVVWGYSLTKRFTALCHVVLGVGLGLAPTGVWIALTGGYAPAPLVLSLAVLCWVAGFDIIYSCQDAAFDREEGLRSVPAALGIRGALAVSAALHVVTVCLLAALPWLAPLGWPYAVGLAIIAGVLIYEHAIVTPTDLSRVDAAFFNLNGWVSILFLGFVVLASWTGHAAGA